MIPFADIFYKVITDIDPKMTSPLLQF
jgi:hypothetical protein